MPTRFQYLEELPHAAPSKLWRALDTPSGEEIMLRRYSVPEGDIPAARHLLETVANLKHPHLETVLEAGVDAEGLYAIIEPTEGETLVELLAHGPLTMKEFHQIAEQILSALSALHDAGDSHVALRPEVVRVRRLAGDTLDARVVGFGEALIEDDVLCHRCSAPEQWNFKPVGRRTDVYALGCIFYEMLSGRAAFEGATMEAMMDAHLKNDLPPLDQLARQAPLWVTSWVTKLITPKADMRLKNATQAHELYLMGEASLPATAPRRDITRSVPTHTGPTFARTSPYIIAPPTR